MLASWRNATLFVADRPDEEYPGILDLHADTPGSSRDGDFGPLRITLTRGGTSLFNALRDQTRHTGKSSERQNHLIETSTLLRLSNQPGPSDHDLEQFGHQAARERGGSIGTGTGRIVGTYTPILKPEFRSTSGLAGH